MDIKNELMTYASFADYEQAFDSEIRKEGESFIRIGFLLRIGQDTEIIKQSGYRNVEEFAKAKYDIDKSQASRYMRINEMFSEGGYSDRLQEKYQGFGVAKLAIMLQLPMALNEELSKDFSKSEINALKEEFDEEKKVSDLEVLMEGPAKNPLELDSNLEKAVYQMLHDDAELYQQIWDEVICTKGATDTEIQQILAPSGESIRSIRIPGVGRKMISVKDVDTQIVVIDARSGEKEHYTWPELTSALLQCFISDKQSAVESWEAVYEETFPAAVAEEPKKAEVAPVQRPEKKKESKPTAKKVSKVQKAKIPEPAKEEKEPEPQVEGQKNIYDYKEAIQEGMEVPADVVNTECEADSVGVQKVHTLPVLENTYKSSKTVIEQEEIIQNNNREMMKAVEVAIREENVLVAESTAAVIEDCAEITPNIVETVDKIWDRLKLNVAMINIYIRNNKGYLEYIEENSLQTVYKKAIDVAADMERLINVKKHHTA